MSETEPVAWEQVTSEVQEALAAWHRAHPTATLAELETAVEEQLGRLRVTLLAERVATTATALSTERPRCASCGKPLQARGARTRTLTIRGDQPLPLTRPYYACPACGGGIFPPR